jgi:hypothetical protein
MTLRLAATMAPTPRLWTPAWPSASRNPNSRDGRTLQQRPIDDLDSLQYQGAADSLREL